jgi:ADP-dependent NAD(P)H-hydrate dehydratase / NAD(P)H-hydrate epimerase
MKLFRSDQIKQIDEYTINEEPVTSVELMERAAGQLLKWYVSRFERSHRIYIFAGPGNNGGDGLALARLLDSNRYDCVVYFIQFTEKTSGDWKTNLNRLKQETKVPVKYITASDAGSFPVISSGDIIFDAIFGSGLTRPVEGLAKDIIKRINGAGATVISIDIPSGLFGEDNTSNDYENIIKADYTLSFQFPKISFMFAENARFCGEWVVLPIGLSPDAIRNIISPYSLLEKDDVAPLLKKRSKFAHKGNFGHGLLIAGSFGKMGAAVLGARAALRTGIGLLTCHIPLCGVTIVQSSISEAMVDPDKNEMHLSEVVDTGAFDAIGVGPGIGTDTESQNALHDLLTMCKKPVVIDADGLNILSLNKSWYSLIPENAILTPHPKEFERLAGKSENSYERLTKQLKFSKNNKCIVILKGAHTSVTTPAGNVFFNSTGNPGMATAGSGDVLTGILLSLLAQGYSPENAAVLGVYLHGLAGDFAAEELCYESIIATDITKCLSKAFNKIREL